MENEAPDTYNSPIIAANNPVFMMSSEPRECCFLIFSIFLIIMTFFLCVIRRFGRLCFIGNNGVGFRAVKVFAIKYYPKPAKVWRFFAKPEGLDLY
jgi:hypothetical protein